MAPVKNLGQQREFFTTSENLFFMVVNMYHLSLFSFDQLLEVIRAETETCFQNMQNMNRSCLYVFIYSCIDEIFKVGY